MEKMEKNKKMEELNYEKEMKAEANWVWEAITFASQNCDMSKEAEYIAIFKYILNNKELRQSYFRNKW